MLVGQQSQTQREKRAKFVHKRARKRLLSRFWVYRIRVCMECSKLCNHPAADGFSFKKLWIKIKTFRKILY